MFLCLGQYNNIIVATCTIRNVVKVLPVSIMYN